MSEIKKKRSIVTVRLTTRRIFTVESQHLQDVYT